MFVAVLGLAPLAVADDAQGENKGLSARSFQFEHRDAGRAAVVIKPLISARGSVSIQPSTNTLVVTDSAAVLREVAEALAQFDAPSRTFELELMLVAASRAPEITPVPEDLREIATKLSGVLRFNTFEKLGEITTEGREGDPVLVGVNSHYRSEFRIGEFDPVSQSLRVEEFRLNRILKENGELQPLLKPTTLNLRLGQTLVLGASRDPESNRTLMIVLVARRPE